MESGVLIAVLMLLLAGRDALLSRR